ncbi:type II toxin-antitoxin system VapC family toxin [Pistricoccus aurantiacus]|uniref:type II toxin-antitoxin system VapC family toxin n=1 Tax=Pistricoccus aurantiacus TaxID=1883414 RepID=UPI00363323A5
MIPHKGYMLDTNILIYLIKNKPSAVAERINALDDKTPLCMSFITYAELLKGAERSTKSARVIRQLEDLVRYIPVRWQVTRTFCEHYARQSTRLQQADTPIGANDLWIACHALSEDMTLVTHNTREFCRIEALKLEGWTERS